MTPDERLKQALGLGAEEPAAVDPAFVVRVGANVERRRFWLGLAMTAIWAIAAAVLIGAIMPVLSRGAAPLETALRPAALALLIVAAVWLASGLDLEAMARRARRVAWPGRI